MLQFCIYGWRISRTEISDETSTNRVVTFSAKIIANVTIKLINTTAYSASLMKGNFYKYKRKNNIVI